MTDPVTRTKQGDPRRFLDKAIGYAGDDHMIWPYATGGKRDYPYPQMRDGDRVRYVTRMVLYATVGPPPAPDSQAAHDPLECNIPLCVNRRHLRWASPAENHADIELAGNRRRGGDVPGAVLDAAKVEVIRSNPGGLSQREMADLFGCSQSTISRVATGQTWSGWV